MDEKQILQYCLRNGISVEQYFILHLTRRRAEGWRQEFLSYVEKFPWSKQDILALHSKGMIEFPGPVPEEIMLEGFALSEDLDETDGALQSTEMADELWEAYPATFPLSGGQRFIARTGMNKQTFTTLYLNKIGRDPEKHLFVMQQLERYIKMVNSGKIHGNKISDWVDKELWNAVSEIASDLTNASSFQTDI